LNQSSSKPHPDRLSDAQSAALLKAMFDAADVMAGVFELLDGDYRYVIANRNAAAFYGRADEGLTGLTGSALGLSAEQLKDRLAVLRRVWERGEAETHEYRFTHPGGRSGWFLGTFSPLPGPTPQVSFVIIDMTARAEAQQQARRHGERLALALDASGLGLWEYDLRRDRVDWDARTRELFGAAPDETIDMERYMARLHPEEAPALRAKFEAALGGADGGRYVTEHRVLPPGGEPRWIRGWGQVLFDPSGKPVRVLGTVQDITEEVAARRRQALLIAELNHRVKNNMATVQSMARQTARASDGMETFLENFEGRLISLAAAHDVLTRNAWAGADISELLQRELSAFPDRIAFSGPPVRLTATQALAVSLIVHELATNAAKYGALTAPQGRVEVEWRVEDEQLELRWSESGGPPVEAPRRTGFGSRLIENLAAGDLRGAAVTDYAPEGLRCTVRAPLQAAEAALPPD
jgi:PAS domain S-box-containing protein